MNKQGGFSLMEMVIVMVIIGIIAVVATSQMPNQQIFQADGFREVLVQDLRLTQALSMSQNQRYRIVVGASSYQIQNQSGSPVTNPETGGDSTVYPTGLTVTPTTTVAFDGMGRPYDGGGAALGGLLTFTVTAGSYTHSASVTAQAGFLL